jgi:hypothetical protein
LPARSTKGTPGGQAATAEHTYSGLKRRLCVTLNGQARTWVD